MRKSFSYTVSAIDEKENLPLKDYLRKKMHLSSRLITKIKKNSGLLLNGEIAPAWIVPKANDVISILIPEEKSNFPPQNIDIDVIYEDEDILLINKQPFIVVHPTSSHPDKTIANGLMYWMNKELKSFKIRFVNRLDRDTSGILIVGKNSHAQNQLSKQMKENTIQKKYIALVHGILDEDFGTIDAPIGRPNTSGIKRVVMEDGYNSVTHYKVLKRFPPETTSISNPIDRECLDKNTYRYFLEKQLSMTEKKQMMPSEYLAQPSGFTLLELTLETGRTHQIRVHLSHLGHCIVGDTLYGIPSDIIDRQALHAYHLKFSHPTDDNILEITAPIPKDISYAITKIK